MCLFSHFFFKTLPSWIKALCYSINDTALADSKYFISAFFLNGSSLNCENLIPSFINLANSLVLSDETDSNLLFDLKIILMWYCFEFYTNYYFIPIFEIIKNLEIGLHKFVFLQFPPNHSLALSLNCDRNHFQDNKLLSLELYIQFQIIFYLNFFRILSCCFCPLL